MRFTLRQLEVFLAIAHDQNVTRAAASLAMSQSAASSALKDLEHQFDVTLFDRVGKRLQLNETGILVRPCAEALLGRARELEELFEGTDAIGPLRIGATLTIGNHVAVDLLARFLIDAPDAHVDLEIANTEEIARRVQNFEVDIGLIEGELRGVDLEIIPWHGDELVICCEPNHPWARKSKLLDRHLLEERWILREPGSGTRQAFDRAMQGLLPDLNIFLELQQTEAILQAVRAGLGVSCLSRLAVQDAFERGDLAPARMSHRSLERSFYISLQQQKYRGAAMQRWLALCEDWNPRKKPPQ